MKRNKGIHSFKDNLKNIILHESFVKVLELELIGIFIVVFLGLLWGVHKNRSVNTHVKNTLNTIISSYDEFLSGLNKTDNILLADVSTSWHHTILKNLYKISFKTGLETEIYLLDSKKNVYLSNTNTISEEERNIISRQWNIINLIKENPDKLNIYISKGKEKAVFLGRAVKDRGGRRAYTVLKIGINKFNHLFSKGTIKVALVQKDFWAIMLEVYKLTDNIGKLSGSIQNAEGLKFTESGFYYVHHEELKYSGFYIYTISDYTEALKLIIAISLSSIFAFIIIFAFGSVGIEKAAKESTKDISVLNEAFLQVSEGNLSTNLEIHSSSEFENIGKCFNEMLYKLKNHIKMNQELAEEVAYEQVKQLASQFKSHFLFNTLDNIRHICRISPDITEQMVLALSELLRYNVGNRNEKVNIKEDFKYIERYLEIMSIRHGKDVFRYNISIEKDVEHCMTLKLLIQPLVENAIKYGFIDNESLTVSVSAEKRYGDVYLICEDSGQGIKNEILEKIVNNLSKAENKTPHLGLYNVNRRVYLTYGKGYGLQLTNVPGLRASIKIPFEPEEESQLEEDNG